jgi:hypothetical protein
MKPYQAIYARAEMTENMKSLICSPKNTLIMPNQKRSDERIITIKT